MTAEEFFYANAEIDIYESLSNSVPVNFTIKDFAKVIVEYIERDFGTESLTEFLEEVNDILRNG
jgi:hypothetical protein